MFFAIQRGNEFFVDYSPRDRVFAWDRLDEAAIFLGDYEARDTVAFMQTMGERGEVVPIDLTTGLMVQRLLSVKQHIATASSAVNWQHLIACDEIATFVYGAAFTVRCAGEAFGSVSHTTLYGLLVGSQSLLSNERTPRSAAASMVTNIVKSIAPQRIAESLRLTTACG
jgi:hypothetical protein